MAKNRGVAEPRVWLTLRGHRPCSPTKNSLNGTETEQLIRRRRTESMKNLGGSAGGGSASTGTHPVAGGVGVGALPLVVRPVAVERHFVFGLLVDKQKQTPNLVRRRSTCRSDGTRRTTNYRRLSGEAPIDKSGSEARHLLHGVRSRLGRAVCCCAEIENCIR